MEFTAVMQTRRSVNFFDPEQEVSQDQLRKLVELAALAPSGFNLQPWNLLVLRSQKDKMRLRKLAWDQPKITEAPVVLIFLADREGWQDGNDLVERSFAYMQSIGRLSEEGREWFSRARHSLYGQNPETRLAFAVKNTAFFAMSMMLAAKDLGLDSHPMDGFDHQAVKQEFKIPERYWVVMLLSVGYFNQNKSLTPPKGRKSYEETILCFE